MTAVIIISGLLVLFAALNLLYKNSRRYYATDIQRFARVKQGKWDIVNLGSSYSYYGFDYEGSGLKGYNLGMTGQFFYYTDLILRQYSAYFNKGCIVLLVIPDLVFARVGKDMYGGPDRYMGILDKKSLEIKHYIWKYFSRITLPLIGNPRLILTLLKEYFDIIRGKYKDRMLVETNPWDKQTVVNYAVNRYNGWCKDFSVSGSGAVSDELARIFVQTRQILTNMIQFCLDHEFRPVLVVTPVAKELNDLLSDDFVNKVLLENISKANIQDILLLLLLREQRFQDSKWYLNADTLNLQGRRYLTRVIIEELEKHGYF
jgi:hypothetical protein